ncbi:unnamed protein product, partial [Symbiodinium sp. CCMP2456]
AKDDDAPVLPEGCFKGLEPIHNRAAADQKKAVEDKPEDDKFKRARLPPLAITSSLQTEEALKKLNESVLQKVK